MSGEIAPPSLPPAGAPPPVSAPAAFAALLASRLLPRRTAGPQPDRVLLRPALAPASGAEVFAPVYSDRRVTNLRSTVTIAPIVRLHLHGLRSPAAPAPSGSQEVHRGTRSLGQEAGAGTSFAPAIERRGRRHEPSPVRRVPLLLPKVTPRDGPGPGERPAGAAPAAAPTGPPAEPRPRRRPEMIVRRAPVEAVPSSAGTSPADSPAAPARRAARARPAAAPPAPARIELDERQIGRLTDRVVEQINRRVVAQRERMGRL